MKCMIILIGMFLCGSTAFGLDHYYLLRVSTPQLVSSGAGIRMGQRSGQLRPTLQGDLGVGGGRILVGLDNTGESRFGHGLKAAILRSWLEPLSIDAGQTFMGLETEWSVRRLVVHAGGYRRISSGDDNWIFSTGLGFVF